MELWPKALALLLTPPGVIVLIAALGFLLQLKWRFLGGLVVAASLAALWVLSLPLTGRYLLASLESGVAPLVLAADAKPEAQAIVVLGASRYPAAPEYGEDTIGSYALERLRYAAHLHRRTGLPILVSGGAPFGEEVPEAMLMQKALEHDFRAKPKWVEADSRNTAESARLSKKILDAEGIRRVYLVTHAWHMPRAEWAFVRAGFMVTPAPTAFATLGREDLGPLGYLPSPRGLAMSSTALRERLGLRWYKLTAATDTAQEKKTPLPARN